MTTNFGNTIASIPVANTPTLVINSNVTLTGAAYGKSYKVTGAYVVTLPTLISGSSGMNIGFMNDSTSSVTLNCQGSDYVRVMGVSVATITLVPGDSMVLQNTGGTFCLADSNPTKASLSSPTFTGTPLAPTAAVSTNTTQIATTAFVIGQASGLTPSADAAVASSGASNTFARGDHVHPGPGAGVVTFTQSGTGAVATTVQASLLKYITPEQFGAVGDGVADDGPAFVLMCAYAASSGLKVELTGGKNYRNGRLEIHGTFDVEGNGASVQYLGIGQLIVGGLVTTLNAGSFLTGQWHRIRAIGTTDFTLIGASSNNVGVMFKATGVGSGTGTADSIVNSVGSIEAGVAYPASTMYTVASPAYTGQFAITLSNTTGIVSGMYLMAVDIPSSFSSSGNGPNYIPSNFEYVKVASVSGNTINLAGALVDPYTPSGALYYAPGLAINCSIKNLTVTTTIDAYQCEVRSSIGCSLTNITFAGTCAASGFTFSENLCLSNIEILGAYGGLSCARGTISCDFNNVIWRTRSGVVQNVALFMEEAFKKVSLTNFDAKGGSLIFQNLDNSNGNRKGIFTCVDSVIDSTYGYAGSIYPFAGTTVNGYALFFDKTRFLGAVSTQAQIASAGYPGVTGNAMVWITSTVASDSLVFTNCQFIATNSGPMWPSAIGGFLGSVLFDPLCTYQTVSPPLTAYTPRGAWSTLSVSSPFTALSGYTAPSYRIQDKTLYLTGAIQINSAVSGSICFTLPAGARPITNKLLAAGSGLASGSVAVPICLAVTSSGGVTAFWNTGTAYFGLEDISFPLDI